MTDILISSDADADLTRKIQEVDDYIAEHFDDIPKHKFQLGVSGGKDSTASYLLFMELNVDFVANFADTGNEHPDTVEHAMTLSERTGGPPVQLVARDYTEEEFAVRRENLVKKWSKPHKIMAGAKRGEMMPAFPQHLIDEALELLHPTGNRFLDMALLHGMFPNRMSQFCTLELKIQPVDDQIVKPLIADGYTVIASSGVRRDESTRRKNLARHEAKYDVEEGKGIIFRPILDWTAADCFAMHRRHGIEPNPLYKQGMDRVGCMPCIHASQRELVEIHKRFPEQLERIEQWERMMAKVSRWALFHGEDATSFLGPRNMSPYGSGEPRTMFFTAVEFVKWLGENKSAVDLSAEPEDCSSTYGLCE